MKQLYHGDCLEIMKTIPAETADLIFTDLPYGSTHNRWDSKIPLAPWWNEAERILKIGGAVLLFAQMRFAVELINSNPKWFRYEWIWKKTSKQGFLDANRRPLRAHELILVFAPHQTKYHPQKVAGPRLRAVHSANNARNYGKFRAWEYDSTTRYPSDIIKFSNGGKHFHPTEKPVPLLEYFIKTYTDYGDTVLDTCMGSGSCGVAAIHQGRSFIGIEKEDDYFQYAAHRLENVPIGEADLFGKEK